MSVHAQSGGLRTIIAQYMYRSILGRSPLLRSAISLRPQRTVLAMPQTTLGKGLKISSQPPSPAKAPKPKNNSKLTPAVAAAKSNGNQGRFSGKESSLPNDLEKLGLSRTYLEELHQESVEQGSKGNDEAKDRPSEEELKKGSKAEADLQESETKGSSRSKNKTSNYAPTKDDVDIEDPDHQEVAKEIQDDIASSRDQQKVGNASVSHTTKESKSGSEAKSEAGTAVSGAKDGRGKKRAPSPDEGGAAGERGKRHKAAYEVHQKIAHPINAARVDREPPMQALLQAQAELWGYKADGPALTKKAKAGTPLKGKKPDINAIHFKKAGLDGVEKGESVVYWMRMEDLRVVDNRALALASDFAQQNSLPLIVMFILVPGEYKAHDRSARAIDFRLRNLRSIKTKLDAQNIPLHIHTHTGNRFKLPKTLIQELLPNLKATHLFANMEYEVDELRRDTEVVTLGGKSKHKVRAMFVHDRLAVPPGTLKTGQGKPYGVFSPFCKKWQAFLDANPEHLFEASEPDANDEAIRSHPIFGKLFEDEIPKSLEGFECEDEDLMNKIWPEGTESAVKVLNRFLYCAAQKSDLGLVDPRTQGAERSTSLDSDDDIQVVEDSAKGKKTSKGTDPHQSRLRDYASSRNSADSNTSSRMSPYLASGVISIRMVLNKIKKLLGNKLESGRDSGPGTWVMECAWRDFYNNVVAEFPRTSMGRPFLEKFANVQWEVNEDKFNAWKDGRTGFPIVDAAMRQCKYMGWMHNRPRMICASFLVKDLMIDWHLGEQFFMQQFIDGDLAANNGGWQWTASTGTDPQPYFRIFNPTSQSETASPDGAYIRYWVPELSGVSDKAIHDPHGKLNAKEFAKLDYPAPIVDHSEARARALARYKNPGEGDAE